MKRVCVLSAVNIVTGSIIAQIITITTEPSITRLYKQTEMMKEGYSIQ